VTGTEPDVRSASPTAASVYTLLDKVANLMDAYMRLHAPLACGGVRGPSYARASAACVALPSGGATVTAHATCPFTWCGP